MSEDMLISSVLTFFVNGKKVVEENPDPEWTLLHYLRRNLGLCGTKLGCAEGGCGTCTVMVSKYNRNEDKIIHLAVNACLAPVCSMHGLAVTTIEGIGSTKTRLHPVQERIAKAHGSQCGFCTPGIVMSMYTLLRNMPKPSYKDLEVTFQGNLCRCTGYRPIIEGYRTFTEEWERERTFARNSNGVCGLGDKCCKNNKTNGVYEEPRDTFVANDFKPFDPLQEPIFPPELKLESLYDSQKLIFKGTNVSWYRPQTLEEILELKSLYNDAKIVVGNTEVGVEVKFKNCIYPTIIMPTQIPEMTILEVTDEGLTVGAAVTLSDMESIMKNLINEMPPYKTRIFLSVVEMLHRFAGKQTRNVAAVGGNIMTGSPISDLIPICMAAGVYLTFKSSKQERSVKLDDKFFTGYRKCIAEPDELLISLKIPFTKENQYFKSLKQAKRRDDDIAIVNMSLSVEFEIDSGTIKNMDLAFGGMAPTIIMVKNTTKMLCGHNWNDKMIQKAFGYLLDELPLSPSAPGGMVQYRRSLMLSLFFKAYLEIAGELSNKLPDIAKIPDRERSGIGGFAHGVLKSSQFFNIKSDDQASTDTVGRPTVHTSGLKHATGEAVYCDDMPLIQGELFLALVLSTKSHANIKSINCEKALAMPGVHAFFCADDIEKDKNKIGAVVQDEEVFVSKLVESQGQVLGAIVAETQSIARKAASTVEVDYDELKPIITIQDAIDAKSYFTSEPKRIVRGDVNETFKKADFIIENDFRMGGQKHFYLETQVCRAVPKIEDNEFEIYASNQHPSELSSLISRILEIPINRITTKVKRIGGGFGGKESRGMPIAIPVAIAAYKLQKPVRCMLDRDEDMMMTGGRHPFYFKYQIAVTKHGKIIGAKMQLYNNGGWSTDLTLAVMERALVQCDNSYFIPNIELLGYICKTNLPTNTVFRGSGGPQAMLLAENYIRDIALALGKSPIEIARINLYQEGQYTYFNQKLTHCTLTRCWEECLIKSEYEKRKCDVDKYNSENRWKKRGISVVPTKFGIAFPLKFLNQAGALVLVYTDGSVLLTHGGAEMGQGLHTKMLQIASRVLQIDMSMIHISETSTDKVPNTAPTAASVSSDINGMAVLRACEQIVERLEPIKKSDPDGKWEDWVKKAYFECISLSAVGYYSTPDIGYIAETNEEKPFNYYSYGAACSEVEIDCLTGDHRILRTDIVMDVGESLNPAIDIGQIEGAFLQGYGLFSMEEVIVSPTGTLYSQGPGAYKIPGFTDIPEEFNVSLLKGAPNPRAVYSSKAVGEPPLFLASSVFFAIKEAVTAARKDSGAGSDFKFSSPATAERIRMACQDHITSKLIEPEPGTYIPWNIAP